MVSTLPWCPPSRGFPPVVSTLSWSPLSCGYSVVSTLLWFPPSRGYSVVSILDFGLNQPGNDSFRGYHLWFPPPMVTPWYPPCRGVHPSMVSTLLWFPPCHGFQPPVVTPWCPSWILA